MHTQGWAKVGLQFEYAIVLSLSNYCFRVVLLFNNYCIIFHTNNCKPTFAPPCTEKLLELINRFSKFARQNQYTEISCISIH